MEANPGPVFSKHKGHVETWGLRRSLENWLYSEVGHILCPEVRLVKGGGDRTGAILSILKNKFKMSPQKIEKMAPKQLFRHNPSPRHPKLIWKDVICTLLFFN